MKNKIHFIRYMTTLFMAMVIVISCEQEEPDGGNDVMILDICGTKEIENPSDEQIRTELGNLNTKNGPAFAILSPTSMTYIQVSGDKTAGFALEYQQGSMDAHFRATDMNVPLQQAIEAFIAYRDGSTSWRDSFSFDNMTL